ncbi:MAG: hypothetical protein ACTSSJ_00610 [Candidatus Odinarchaeia archaeon]
MTTSEDEFIVVDELTPNSRGVNLKVKVLSKNEVREVISRRTGETLRVTEALVGDETGCVYLTLWNDLIDQVDVDKIYKINNGYCTVFKGSLRLNTGRYGSVEPLEDADFGEVNTENNLSDREYETPRRPRFQRRSFEYFSDSPKRTYRGRKPRR